MGQFTYVVSKTCPICEKETRLIKTKARVFVLSIDEDYCSHCKDFDPYLYTMLTCEHCGYSADEKHFFEGLSEKNLERLRELLIAHPFPLQFSEERSLNDAVAVYKLAIYCAEQTSVSRGRKAGMYLRFAWIYRKAGKQEEEAEMLRRAVELYEAALNYDRFPVENLTERMAVFLIGAISFRLKDYDKCYITLAEIVGNFELRDQDPKFYAKARDIWQQARTIRKNIGKDVSDTDEIVAQL